MQYISGAMNFGGKVSHADLRQPDPAGPVHLSYDYMREDFADWKNNRAVQGLLGKLRRVSGKYRRMHHRIYCSLR